MRWAHIDWKEDGQPEAPDFGDVYFSALGGLDETNHVFLNGNRLRERFKTAQHFTIIETGFGTGLNFLATWKLWQEVAPTDATLHYISTEKFPLTLEDLSKALSLWQELEPLPTSLLTNYINILKQPSVNINNNLKISLHIGDVKETLPRITEKADAWFLDGFSPSKNPDMWQQELYQNMASLSHTGTTLATFTSAGHVRRGLEKEGFVMSKQKGFAHKREMITGIFRP